MHWINDKRLMRKIRSKKCRDRGEELQSEKKGKNDVNILNNKKII